MEDDMNEIMMYKGEQLKKILKHYATTHLGFVIRNVCASALRRIEQLEKMDTDAANYVECPIVMRTKFTGDAPYVGWKGLGLALSEALDELDALKSVLATKGTEEEAQFATRLALNYSNLRQVNKELLARVDLLERNIKILHEATIKERENDHVCSSQNEETGESC
jgi:hypothetical protein